MASPIATLKSDWRHFKHDAPGERFVKQRDRAHRRSPAMTIVLAMLGVVFIAGGVVLLFFPGPGFVVIALGLALISSASRTVARAMDRAEPVVRRRWAAVKRRFRRTRR